MRKLNVAALQTVVDQLPYDDMISFESSILNNYDVVSFMDSRKKHHVFMVRSNMGFDRKVFEHISVLLAEIFMRNIFVAGLDAEELSLWDLVKKKELAIENSEGDSHDYFDNIFSSTIKVMDATNWYEKLCIKYSSALSERIVRSPPTDIKMPFKRDDVHNHHSHMLLLMTLFMGHAFDEFNSGPCKISDAERQLHKEVFGDLSGSQKKGLILVGEPYDIKRMTTDFFYNDYMSTKKLLNIFIHETNCSQRHRRYILEL